MLSGGTPPTPVPEDELLELEELDEEDDEDEEDDDEDEELLNPDEEDELLELELDDEEVGSVPPPHATKLSANKHELAIVTGRCQPTSVFIEDIFTYLFLVNTHCELEVFFFINYWSSPMPELTQRRVGCYSAN